MKTLKQPNPQFIWGQLQAAIDNPASPFRVLVLGTTAHEAPELRSVVLREIDPDQWLVRIYTDLRSPKVLQVRNNPQVSLLFWDAQQKVQLRAKGIATIIDDVAYLKVRWDKISQGHTANDYKGELAPSSELDQPLEFVDRHWFGVIEIHVTSFDYLQLDRLGHQRWAVTNDSVTALVP